MLGIAPEEASRQLSPPSRKRCGVFFFYLPGTNQYNPGNASESRYAAAAKRHGAWHPHPTAATSSGRSEKAAAAKRRRCAWPATNLARAPPPDAIKRKMGKTKPGAKCRRARRNAILRRRPPSPSAPRTARNAPDSALLPAETDPPPHGTRLRETESEKKKRKKTAVQFRCGLVVGTTAGDTNWSGSR